MNHKQQYKHYCKPKLSQLLSSLGLDQNYTKAEGNYLITDNGKKVLDCVSGFGSAILGHNHPELINELVTNLTELTPIVAQGSIQSDTAVLAERLNQYTPSEEKYLVHFSNSGAESVEAAIKHAYKVHYDKIEKEYERITRVLDDFYYQYENSENKPILPNNKKLVDFRDDLDEYNLEQFELFKNKPVMISFKGAYHGKTTSSLKVTFNKSFREAFEGLSAIQNVFIDRDKPEKISETLKQEVCTFYYPVITHNEVTLKPITLTRVMGLIFELIMGEGGIIPLPNSTLKYLAKMHSSLELPYIIDEIQTGCGRLGEIFYYAKTPLAEISPDYILLSKSLGGGVSKIGATLIKESIYEQDFGILHTSTFGEDKLSSKTSIKMIDILTKDENAILNNVTSKGKYLKQELRKIQKEYPNVIKEVRGKGLMIGVEFTSLDERSPFFRAAGKQGVLSLLAASFLMYHHNIRVLAPISTMLKGNPGKKRLSIIRIQPAAIIEQHEMNELILALREVCKIINNNNEYCFVGHLAGTPPTGKDRKDCSNFEARYPMNDEYRHIDARVGFILHPTTTSKLVEYYFPSFESYNWKEKGLNTWWNTISRFLEPVHVKNEYISSNDFVVEMALVFVPYLPEYVTHAKEAYLQKEIRDKIQDAVTIARELGDDNIPVSIVGLGAYTSIATRNGESINYYEMPITTGNAYTVGLSIQGVICAAEKRGLNLSTAKLAVVGAGGNIGSVVAQILAPRVGQVMLVGSDTGASSLFRLKYTRRQCIYEILKEISNLSDIETAQLGTVAKFISSYINKKNINLNEINSTQSKADFIIEEIEKHLNHTKNDDLFSLLTNLDKLKNADIIIVATNSADKALINPSQVKPNAIICGTSVPSNLSQEFSNSKQILAFDGGFAQLPDESTINFVGMPKDGLAYGCLAETLVLGFDGQNHSFSKGPLTSEQVYKIMDVAQTHGFDLGTLKLNDKPLVIEEEDNIKGDMTCSIS